MGDLQREIERIQADHNDNVAELQKQADEGFMPRGRKVNKKWKMEFGRVIRAYQT